MPERQAIADRLKEFREFTHKTRTECASEMGLSREQYRFMERQEADCKLSTLKKVSLAISTTIPELLRVDEENACAPPAVPCLSQPEHIVLAKRVRELRKAHGESQDDFAANVGITTKLLSLIENGQTNPKLSTLQKIAAYANVTVTDLFEADKEEADTHEV